MILLAVLVVPATADATWFYVHGHEGQVEDPQNLYFVNGNHIGWGTDIILNGNTSTWMHYAVPSIGNVRKKVRFLKAYVNIFSNATIDTISVYNGWTKVQEYTSLGYTNGAYELTIDLGSYMNFNMGLGVSINMSVGSSADAYQRRVIFGGVGASFVKR